MENVKDSVSTEIHFESIHLIILGTPELVGIYSNDFGPFYFFAARNGHRLCMDREDEAWILFVSLKHPNYINPSILVLA